MRSIRDIQKRLAAVGFDPGPVDGIMGPQTEAAITRFKRSVGLRARPYYGPKTDALLFGHEAVADPSDLPPWMVVARSLDGLREIPGSRHSDRIISMWERLKLPFRDDETPWCAAFVGYCLERAGFPSTRSAAARSYERWEGGMRIREPVVGAVATFWRGRPDGWSGHVGFVEGVDQRGRLIVRGGNQGNRVCAKPFGRERLTGLFWPKGYPLPSGNLMRVHSDAASSTNEA